MWDILKFIAIAFFILLILAFALPLLWVVIKEIALLFGGLFVGVGGTGLIWLGLFVISIIVIIVCLLN